MQRLPGDCDIYVICFIHATQAVINRTKEKKSNNKQWRRRRKIASATTVGQQHQQKPHSISNNVHFHLRMCILCTYMCPGQKKNYNQNHIHIRFFSRNKTERKNKPVIQLVFFQIFSTFIYRIWVYA